MKKEVKIEVTTFFLSEYRTSGSVRKATAAVIVKFVRVSAAELFDFIHYRLLAKMR